MSRDRSCAICRSRYKFCSSCMADSTKPRWMTLFCSENCKDIYYTINDYRYKVLSKADAFDKLNSLDLSCIDKLPENFKEMIAEILLVKPDESMRQTQQENVDGKPVKIRKRKNIKTNNEE